MNWRVAAVTGALFALPVMAQDPYSKPEQKPQQQTEPMPSGEQQTGKPMDQMQGGEQRASMDMQNMQKEITGKLLGMHEKLLYIEGAGGEAIPVRVTHETKVEGQPLKKDQRIESHLKKDFQPGAEIRASFDVKEERGEFSNVATSVDLKK